MIFWPQQSQKVSKLQTGHHTVQCNIQSLPLWSTLCPIVISISIFFQFYRCYFLVFITVILLIYLFIVQPPKVTNPKHMPINSAYSSSDCFLNEAQYRTVAAFTCKDFCQSDWKHSDYRFRRRCLYAHSTQQSWKSLFTFTLQVIHSKIVLMLG